MPCPPRLVTLALATLLAAPAAAQPAETIGSWLLLCSADRMTDATACVLQHQRPVEAPSPGQAALALEVIERDGRLLPAITARDLTLDGAARGMLALAGSAQLRFPPQRLFELPCALEGRSLICLPRPEDAPRAEAELARAPVALVRMQAVAVAPASGEPVELPLAGTAQAVARYRALVPPGSQPPARPGIGGRDLLGRLLRDLGL